MFLVFNFLLCVCMGVCVLYKFSFLFPYVSVWDGFILLAYHKQEVTLSAELSEPSQQSVKLFNSFLYCCEKLLSLTEQHVCFMFAACAFDILSKLITTSINVLKCFPCQKLPAQVHNCHINEWNCIG